MGFFGKALAGVGDTIKHAAGAASRPSPASARASGGDLTGATVTIQDRSVRVGAMFAEGGNARVYRASDVGTGAAVALKQSLLPVDDDALEPGPSADAQLAAARKEAETHQKFADHPNVVKLFGFDASRVVAASGAPAIQVLLMMELCEKSLVAHVQEAVERRQKRERLMNRGEKSDPNGGGGVGVPEPEALAIFASAARAVAAMHAASPPVCHRDVKPENLLLGADGAWKLCDFGSASVGETSLRTPAERLAAESDFAKNTTPAYRAPEMHDAHRWPSVGPPADAFALGCLLYQLLFARVPFGQEAKIPALSGALRFPSDRKPATPGGSAAATRAAGADDAAGPDASDETKRLVRELLATEPSARPETATLPRRAERIAAALGKDPAAPELEIEKPTGIAAPPATGPASTASNASSTAPGAEEETRAGWALFAEDGSAAYPFPPEATERASTERSERKEKAPRDVTIGGDASLGATTDGGGGDAAEGEGGRGVVGGGVAAGESSSGADPPDREGWADFDRDANEDASSSSPPRPEDAFPGAGPARLGSPAANPSVRGAPRVSRRLAPAAPSPFAPPTSEWATFEPAPVVAAAPARAPPAAPPPAALGFELEALRAALAEERGRTATLEAALAKTRAALKAQRAETARLRATLDERETTDRRAVVPALNATNATNAGPGPAAARELEPPEDVRGSSSSPGLFALRPPGSPLPAGGAARPRRPQRRDEPGRPRSASERRQPDAVRGGGGGGVSFSPPPEGVAGPRDGSGSGCAKSSRPTHRRARTEPQRLEAFDAFDGFGSGFGGFDESDGTDDDGLVVAVKSSEWTIRSPGAPKKGYEKL